MAFQFSQGALAEHMFKHSQCHSLSELASHGYLSTEYLCYCLLFSKGYIVADAIAYLMNPQCSYVVPSISTHQCAINTTPLQVEALVPRFQEPLTADDESGLIP